MAYSRVVLSLYFHDGAAKVAELLFPVKVKDRGIVFKAALILSTGTGVVSPVISCEKTSTVPPVNSNPLFAKAVIQTYSPLDKLVGISSL
jgi:hypothetical protein